jgi:hypothetical protein
MGMLIGRELRRLGVVFVYYNGNMAQDQKQNNLWAFRGTKDNPSEIKVMVSSLMCIKINGISDTISL